MEPPEQRVDSWSELSINDRPLKEEKGKGFGNRAGRGPFKGISVLTIVLVVLLAVFAAAAMFLFGRVLSLKSELRDIEGRMAALSSANEGLRKEASGLSERLETLRRQLEANVREAARQRAEAEAKKAAAEARKTATKKPAPKKPNEGRR
jgi:cell division protein FtsB